MHSDLGDGLGSNLGSGFGAALGPVRVASFEELAGLPRVEVAADALLAGYLNVQLPSTPDLGGAMDILARAAAVLVVGAPPVGFAQLDVVDGRAHLQQLAVDPIYGRRGLGTALVQACGMWAARHAFSELTLTTFAQVPFNAPFYSRLGFRVIDDAVLPPGLAVLRRQEAASGLDALGPRVAMRAYLNLRG